MTPSEFYKLREGGDVERAHTLPHIGSYTVGKHTFDMLLLLYHLYPGTPSHTLVRAILHHDLHERWNGDSPPGMRRRLHSFAKESKFAQEFVDARLGISPTDLSLNDQKWLRGLDVLELYIWCIDQRVGYGNNHVHVCEQDCATILCENEIPEQIRAFFSQLSFMRHGGDCG